jgi:membrane-associated protein
MMELWYKLFDLMRHLGEVEKWKAVIDHVGHPTMYVILFLVIFAETGLVITPFLPGDSLLFAIGALARNVGMNLPLTVVLLIVAAVLGDAANYWIGYRVGPAVFTSDTGRLLNKKHLLRAQEFYEKYGGKTIILARFVPVVRTFAPFVAGVGKMNYFRFALYNVVGAVAWVLICVGAGVLFGEMEFVKRNFELVIVAIVLISIMPMVVEFVRARKAARLGGSALVEATTIGKSEEGV